MPVAQSKQKNIVERLADVGEEAIQRIGTAPGADRLLGGVNSLRDRLDDLQKRVGGLEQLDKRLAAVEKRLDKLEGKPPSARKTGSSSRKRSTTPKSSPS
jgi:tetrahydromethanopterin S-methyltransferase subunit G